MVVPRFALVWLLAAAALTATSGLGFSQAEGTRQPIIFEVLVPADAQVFFDGTATTQTGERRQYQEGQTPPPTCLSLYHRPCLLTAVQITSPFTLTSLSLSHLVQAEGGTHAFAFKVPSTKVTLDEQLASTSTER